MVNYKQTVQEMSSTYSEGQDRLQPSVECGCQRGYKFDTELLTHVKQIPASGECTLWYSAELMHMVTGNAKFSPQGLLNAGMELTEYESECPSTILHKFFHDRPLSPARLYGTDKLEDGQGKEYGLKYQRYNPNHTISPIKMSSEIDKLTSIK